MENASKALIMAGGILIGIMVASLFVYLFTTYGSQAEEMYDRINQNQRIQKLNEYTKYEGSKDNTIYDVITVINKAQNNNESLNLNENDRGYISVSIKGLSPNLLSQPNNLQKMTNEELTDLLQKVVEAEINSSPPTEIRFSCFVNDNDGLISSVVFSKVN